MLREVGGTLGFYCAHQYAHTRSNTEELMPYALKGIDATIFMVFQALGVNITVRPILGNEQFDDYIDGYIENLSVPDGDDADEDFDEDEWREEMEAKMRATVRIGDRFHKLVIVDEMTEDGPEEVCSPFPHFLDEVLKLNNIDHWSKLASHKI